MPAHRSAARSRHAARTALLAVLALLALPGVASAAVTSEFDAGLLTVESNAGDPITIACDANDVQVNGADPDNGQADCDAVDTILVTGGPGANAITLTGVDATAFPLLAATDVDGGAGNDTILGSQIDDDLIGGADNDRIVGDNNAAGTRDNSVGGTGDDTLVWNPGDGDDVNEGGDGADTIEVNGGGGGEVFTVAPSTTAGRIAFDRTSAPPFNLDIGTAERLDFNGNGGDDSMTATTGTGFALDLDGGAGNDTLDGGDDPDLLTGGDGNDRLIGDNNAAGTQDNAQGGAGDDTLVWNPGDGDDVNEGGDGADTIEVNGGGGGEVFTVAPSTTAGRIAFDRTSAPPFNLDIGTAERLDFNGNGGDDSMTATTGTGFLLDLDGGAGNDTLDGGDDPDLLTGGDGNDRLLGDNNAAGTRDNAQGGAGDDTLVWNPGDGDDINEGGDGSDTIEVNGGGGGEVFTVAPSLTAGRIAFDRTGPTPPGPFNLDIGTSERLDLNANAGDDSMTSTTPAGFLLDLDGGDGNDTLDGGDGADLLSGGNGNDRLIGDNNPAGTRDNAQGGAGDDTMVWNPGDGDDINEGGDGADTTEVNGGSGGEVFTVKPSATAGRVAFDRTGPTPPGPFNVDIGTTERLVLNAGGGDDRITGARGLVGRIASTLNGDDGNDRITGTDGADRLTGGNGNDVIRSRDSRPDRVICGAGRDLARVDRLDRPNGCELVIGGRAKVRALGKTARVIAGRAVLRLRCVATRRCRGTVRLLRGRRTLGTARFTATRRRAKVVRVRLNARGRRLVARAPARGVRITVQLNARDGAGNGWRTTKRMRLRR